MKLIDLVLIALGLSMDAFAVSVTDGMTLIRLKTWNRFVIALFFGAFQALMPVFGYYLGQGFEYYIKTFAHWVALALLLLIGVRMLIEGRRCETDNNCKLKVFSLKLIAVQAVATSIDALMVGITFAAMDVSLAFSVAVIGLITFAMSIVGVYTGKKFGCLLKSKSEFAGGCILIAIGIKIFVEHTF